MVFTLLAILLLLVACAFFAGSVAVKTVVPSFFVETSVALTFSQTRLSVTRHFFQPSALQISASVAPVGARTMSSI